MAVNIGAGAVDTNKAMALWSNSWASGTITATSAATGYPAINVADPATNNSWKPAVSGGTITLDALSAVTVDAIGIGAHTLSGSTVTVQSSPDNTAWTTRATLAVTNNDDLIFIIASVTARYWRITVTGQPVIGVVFMGARLVFPSAPIDSYTPLNHAKKYTKYFNTSLGGHLISNRVQSMGAATDVDLGFVQRTFVDGALVGFKTHYDHGGTFFYAGCPSLYPLDMGYCTAGSEDETVAVEYIQADRLANLSFGVVAYVGS